MASKAAMNRPHVVRILRYLRIAFSATCLIACLLMVALWVRSYTWMDEVSYVHSPTKVVVVVSVVGQNHFRIGPWQFTGTPRSMIQSYRKPRVEGINNPFLDFKYQATSERIIIGFPSWLPVLLISSLAAVPWLRWQFSLRTLLIVTTLIAVVLGAIVAFSR
jgi:hypothetical protein